MQGERFFIGELFEVVARKFPFFFIIAEGIKFSIDFENKPI